MKTSEEIGAFIEKADRIVFAYKWDYAMNAILTENTFSCELPSNRWIHGANLKQIYYPTDQIPDAYVSYQQPNLTSQVLEEFLMRKLGDRLVVRK